MSEPEPVPEPDVDTDLLEQASSDPDGARHFKSSKLSEAAAVRKTISRRTPRTG